MMKLLQAICFIAVVALAIAEKNYHDGTKVIRVNVVSEEQARILSNYDSMLDFWSNIRIGKHADIAVPSAKAAFPSLLEKMGFTYSVLIEDLGPVLRANERRTNEARAHSAATKQGFDFDIYHTYEEIQEFISDTAIAYSTASVEFIGFSYEGREQNVLKICSGTCGANPVMYIECDIHAREWMTSAVCLKIINELTANAALNGDYTNGLDWYFLMPANPDGYSYTWTDDRMWRKTRTPNEGSDCMGTDPNRNFADHFDDGGSSDFPCSDTYHGPNAFSENCTANIRDFVLANAGDIAYFMDVHSYSELAMYAYGYTTEVCDDDEKLMTLCVLGQIAMQGATPDGKVYECGPIASTIYVASGNTVDWAYDFAKIVRSYTIETRPKTSAGGGFDPPETEIEPTFQEIWAWHRAMAEDVLADPPKHKK